MDPTFPFQRYWYIYIFYQNLSAFSYYSDDFLENISQRIGLFIIKPSLEYVGWKSKIDVKSTLVSDVMSALVVVGQTCKRDL